MSFNPITPFLFKNFSLLGRVTFTLMLLLNCVPVHAQNTAGRTELDSIRSGIIQRDAKIFSLQMFGTLERQSSEEAARKSDKVVADNTHQQNLVKQQNNIQDFYYAAIGEKEVLALRDHSDTMKSSELSPEEQNKLREELLNVEPKVYDGKTSYFLSVRAHAKTVLMKPDSKSSLFGESRAGFRSNFASQPLDALLTDRGYIIAGHELDARFGNLVHLRGTTDEGQVTNLWLAIERDYLIVKEDMLGQGRSVFEVEQAEQTHGVWVPKVYTFSVYSTANSTVSPLLRNTTTYNHISINDVPEKVCMVTLNQGDKVNDMNTGQWWTVGQNGERLYEKPSSESQTSMVPGWLYMASVTTLLVLTVLAYVRWKRKQWSRQV